MKSRFQDSSVVTTSTTMATNPSSNDKAKASAPEESKNKRQGYVFSTDDDPRQGMVFSTDDPLPEEDEKKTTMITTGQPSKVLSVAVIKPE